MTLIAELQRRNVIRMAGLYLVGAWLLTQVASTVLPLFGAPTWVPRTIVIGLAIGLLAKGPLALALCAVPSGGWVLWQRQWEQAWQRVPWIRGLLAVAALVFAAVLLAAVLVSGLANRTILSTSVLFLAAT